MPVRDDSAFDDLPVGPDGSGDEDVVRVANFDDLGSPDPGFAGTVVSADLDTDGSDADEPGWARIASSELGEESADRTDATASEVVSARRLGDDALDGLSDLPSESSEARVASFGEVRRTDRIGRATRGRSGSDRAGVGRPGSDRSALGRSGSDRSGSVGSGSDGSGSGWSGSGSRRPSRDRAGTRGARDGRSAKASPQALEQDDETRAREICLRLLTDRARTVKELGDALRRKEIPDDVADRVLARFDEVGLVDDEAFAGQWVRSRHRQRGLGRRAIAQELRRKGVEKEVADAALSEIDAESEESRARELVERKLRTVRVGTREERAVASRRLVGMLARKGYGGGTAYAVVREAIAARGAQEDELGEAPIGD